MNIEEALEEYATNHSKVAELRKQLEHLTKRQNELKAIALAETIKPKQRKEKRISGYHTNQSIRYMKAIAEYGGKVTLKDLAKLMNVTKQSVYPYMEKMVREGLLRKEMSPKGSQVPPHCIYELIVKPDSKVNHI